MGKDAERYKKIGKDRNRCKKVGKDGGYIGGRGFSCVASAHVLLNCRFPRQGPVWPRLGRVF